MVASDNFDGQLAKVEARIARSRRSAKNLAALPPPVLKIDDLKATGDFIDAILLKRRGALEAGFWTVINRPPLHPAVEKMVCGRTCLQLFFRGREKPQTLPISWRNPTGNPTHDKPLFACGCGRRARKLFPHGGSSYACRWCISRLTTRYKASCKSRPANRVRVRAPIFHGVSNDRLDPVTGRFLPAPAPSPATAPAVSSAAPPAIPADWVELPWGQR